MKKLFAIALAAAMALSLAACTGAGETSKAESSSPASAVESSAESSTEESSKEESKTEESKDESKDKSKTETSDSVEEAKTKLDEAVEKIKTVAGEKTKAALETVKSDTMTVGLELTTETKGEQESSSALGNQTIGFRVIKDGEKASRITIAVGMMSMDILSNEDGTYYLNTATKKAAKINTENSGDSSSILDSMTGMMGGIGSVDPETALEDISDNDISDYLQYKDTTEMEYNGSTYTSENYTVSGKDKDGKDLNSTMNVLFDGDEIKYILAESDAAKMSAVFTTFTTEIDDSQLVVPENYEITETSTAS